MAYPYNVLVFIRVKPSFFVGFGPGVVVVSEFLVHVIVMGFVIGIVAVVHGLCIFELNESRESIARWTGKRIGVQFA